MRPFLFRGNTQRHENEPDSTSVAWYGIQWNRMPGCAQSESKRFEEPMPQQIEQDSLAEKVYNMIKRQILSGELKGGMIIPEEHLAQQFGVSRTPIREAIRRLSEYGLVVLKPRSHAMVYQFTDKQAQDTARVRLALELLTIELLTPELMATHIDDLSRLAADCQYNLGIGNRAELFMKDSMFHLELVKCTGNEALFSMYERLDSRVQLLRISKNFSDELLGNIIHQHLLLLQALKHHDLETCRELMLKHVNHQM